MQYYNQNTAYDFDVFMPRNSNTAAVPQKKQQEKAEIKRLPVTHKKHNSAAFSVFTRFLIAAIILFMICFNIYMRVEISDAKSDISKSNSQLEVLNSERIRLEMELENKICYKNIEQAAADLGMQKKFKSQVHYIDTGKKDVAEVLEGGLN